MSPLPFRRATIRRAGEACAGVLAALAAWELALRPIGPQLRAPPRVIVACDSLESAVVPTRQTEEGIALARFSSCGARLTGHSPVDGARFVVLLGDSYVVAREVNDDETMGARLEEMARAGGSPLNVRQYGWIGVAPAQYLLVADDVLRRWQPDRVVVVLSDDDLGANAVEGPPPRIRILPGGRVGIDTTTRQKPGVPLAPRSLALGTLLEQRWAMVLLRAPAPVRRAFGSFEVGVGGLIDEYLIPEVPDAVVRALSGAYGRRLLVVYLPDVRVTGGDDPGPQESLLLDACKAHAVACVSVRRAMLEARHAGRAVRGFPTTVAGIGHFNAEGHRVIAREIWSAMKAGQ